MDSLQVIISQHDLRLVLLAVVMCLLASAATTALLSRAQVSAGQQKLVWTSIAAIEFGGGIWSLHFVAMIAYMPELSIGYDLSDTAISAVIPMLGAFVGFLLALSRVPRAVTVPAGGLALTAAIAGMHYTGIASMRMPGTVSFDGMRVFCSIALTAGLSIASIWTLRRTLTLRRHLATTSLLAAAVAVLHFGGMAAMAMQMDALPSQIGSGVLGSRSLAVAVAALSIAMLILAFTLSMVDRHLADRTLREKERLHQLVGVSFEGLLIHRDGVILDVNERLGELSGYDPSFLAGRPVSLLVALDGTGGHGLPDPGCEDLVLRRRDGSTIPVELLARPISYDRAAATAIAVRDLTARHRSDLAMLRLRQISTLLTKTPPGPLPPVPEAMTPAPGIGQLRVLSITALKLAYGDGWESIASQALAMAEEVVARALAAEDVFTRAGDDGIAVWFANNDDASNAARLASICREVRLLFLREFGQEVASQVEARLVHAGELGRSAIGAPEAAEPVPAPVPAAVPAVDPAMAAAKNQTAVEQLLASIQELRNASLRPVSDRHGTATKMAILDFPHALGRQAAQLHQALLDARTDIGLLRLDLALRELTVRPRPGPVLVEIPWSSLNRLAFRNALAERLRAAKPAICQQLMLAVASVPSLVDERKWSQAVAPIRSKVSEVGLLLRRERDGITTADMTAAGGWPLSLLVIDASAPNSATADDYASLLAIATGRRVTILAELSAPEETGRWRALGASMLAIPQTAGDSP